MNSIEVRIRRLAHAADLPLPSYATHGAAGVDLCAAVIDSLSLAPNQRELVPTGLVAAIPEGFEGQVRARSGRAWREGLCVLNGPGTLDSDYRGEIRVLLANLGQETVCIRRGDRIAQLVFAAVPRALFVEDPSLCAGETVRGGGGFGSTG